ncbi:hypothetical protein [Natrialba sp. SSL1]|uniref:hypothetical protein n=1 Tax=Natrialba sp. SSL1 TaxID=1869245 RepID=UPI0008F8F2F4|nr:hypothetical protein [Natrialba sp. SSL1]OIB58632.1 hypothetical protein BBD46_07310 [Natrialba sp. SSL1]
MGLFERIAVTDLQFRLILGTAAVGYAWTLIGVVRIVGQDGGVRLGSLAGLVVAAGLGYGVYRLLRLWVDACSFNSASSVT